MHRRVMEKGAELILRDSPTSILPGAIAFGDASRPSASIMLAPIRYGTKVVGILSAQSYKARSYNQQELTTLQALADQCGGGLERIRADEELEHAHKQLLDTSRRAGMAEVASNVLHNVGNVLNSVNVSAALLSERIRGSKISSLVKAMALMRQHPNDLAAFLTEDPKGRQLPGFVFGVIEYLTEEQKGLLKELDCLGKNIEHIKDIVAMQQNYAKVSGLSETVAPAELIEDALRMNEAAFARHQVQVIREYGNVPPITVEKHKVLQILVNLMRNAKYALDEGGKKERPIRLRLERKNGEAIRISVTDYGVGIPAENLTRIFNHGFTTRKHGHGFGLHSGALAAKELGGSLSVHSDGPGKGATFTLELPLKEPKKADI
jgi:signal transduction histidine kinase